TIDIGKMEISNEFRERQGDREIRARDVRNHHAEVEQDYDSPPIGGTIRPRGNIGLGGMLRPYQGFTSAWDDADNSISNRLPAEFHAAFRRPPAPRDREAADAPRHNRRSACPGESSFSRNPRRAPESRARPL